MGVVVALPRRRKAPLRVETSAAFEEAFMAYPESGRLRSSRRESWPEWCAVIAEIGEEDALARVKRYARQDREHKKEHGAPAFHRWLKWGRWEHWADQTALHPVQPPAPNFPDELLRASFHRRFGDESARKWFDRTKLVDGWLVCPPARAEWVNGPFKTWAIANGIEGVRFS